MSWDQVQPFLIALAIGLLMGFERERSHTRRLPAGSRTFALVALMGVLTASISVWLVVAGLAVVGGLMVLAYQRTSTEDPGTTTEVAAIVAYLLGALTWTRPALAVALAVVVVGLLVSKGRLHHFVREVVTEVEVEDAIKFFVVAFVVLPLLPNEDLGPYGVLNPARVWLLVVLLTGIGWLGYIGVKALGPRRGLLVTGLAGGFVSASATTASMGRLARTEGLVRPPLAGALLASFATFVQLLLVIAVVDEQVFARLLPPVSAGALVLAVVVFVVYRGQARDGTKAGVENDPEGTSETPVVHGDTPAPEEKGLRPFALKPALILAGVLTVALLVGRWGAAVLGPRGAVLASGAAGLADAHAGSVAAASLAAKGDITVDTAVVAVSAALGSNLLVKTVLSFTAGGKRFGLAFVAGMALPTAAFGLALIATLATSS